MGESPRRFEFGPIEYGAAAAIRRSENIVNTKRKNREEWRRRRTHTHTSRDHSLYISFRSLSRSCLHCVFPLCCVSLINPLHRSSGMISLFREIHSTDGITGLWRGVGPALVRIAIVNNTHRHRHGERERGSMAGGECILRCDVVPLCVSSCVFVVRVRVSTSVLRLIC